MIKVVNIIPKSLSNETGQDSEPNIAVNPANSQQIAITAFTKDPLGGANAPIFVSTNGGSNWSLNSIVPSQAGSTTGTGDITSRFGGGNRFYAGILRVPFGLRLNILRTTNFSGAAVMSVLLNQTTSQKDQPYTQAQADGSGKDHLYVGCNDFGASGGKTATIEQSQDAGAASPTFTAARIEKRNTSGQNGPQIRPAAHSNGTVYGIFYGWRSFVSSQVTADVTVVRDDSWGKGATPFTSLKDPSDSIAGRLVAKNVKFTWNGTLGHERLGGDLSIAVDPNNSSTVYIAYCDLQGSVYTMHVRRSLDKGVTWSADLKTVSNCKNPALAINSSGLVGICYQRVTGSGSSERWETHLETSSNGFTTSNNMVLATVPTSAPTPTFLPYIGDYIHMMCVGTSFYGVFSANNTPDNSNFPQGVTYLRNADFATKKLLGVNGTTQISASIDPFFFQYTPLVTVTHLTHISLFTPFTFFTVVGPGHPPPGGPVEGLEPSAPVEPFIRFGNHIFSPEELDLARFEPLSGVVGELANIGITRLHQLALCSPDSLAVQLGYPRPDASRLVDLAQRLLRSLTM